MATVFYVDDRARCRRLLSSVLTECGFEVITAADPVDALQRCKEPCGNHATSDQFEAVKQSSSAIGDGRARFDLTPWRYLCFVAAKSDFWR
jgi:CheY-like chemotaxis protein